jgi:DNA-binding XRE family transcriptional regulator
MPYRPPDRDGAIRVTLEHLGDELRLARLDRGLSQDTLAERSGISQSTISRIERGITPGTGLVTLACLVHVLGYRSILRPRDADVRRRSCPPAVPPSCAQLTDGQRVGPATHARDACQAGLNAGQGGLGQRLQSPS